ncbi:hypothetical protein [Nodosilinea nodulosa]|uniref:hypothetical protein n=1 Tax=Nodosilinea nodulosa TaxID=416001 RepID=UPI0018C2FCB0|nr:hypothetical protein [Nodosilinea nodulosa]
MPKTRENVNPNAKIYFFSIDIVAAVIIIVAAAHPIAEPIAALPSKAAIEFDTIPRNIPNRTPVITPLTRPNAIISGNISPKAAKHLSRSPDFATPTKILADMQKDMLSVTSSTTTETTSKSIPETILNPIKDVMLNIDKNQLTESNS